MTGSKKIWEGLYEYKGWSIEFHPDYKIWLMYPEGESGATDAANTKRDAMAMIDEWASQEVKMRDTLCAGCGASGTYWPDVNWTLCDECYESHKDGDAIWEAECREKEQEKTNV